MTTKELVKTDPRAAEVAKAADALRAAIKAHLPAGHDTRWALKHTADAKCLALRVLRAGSARWA